MYTIYHIPTIKIGCTDNVEERTAAQKFDNYEVLEEHLDIYIASDREIALQKQYGLPVDKMPYWKTIQQLTESPKRLEAMRNSELYKEARSKVGLVSGKKNKETGHISNLGKSGIGGKIGGKITGKKNVESGHIQALGKKYGAIVGTDNVKLGRGCMNFENRSKGGKVNSEKGTGLFGMDKDSIYKSTSKGGKITTAIQRQCPHCNKTIKGPSYFTWHGDKCKAKPQ